MPEIPTAAPDFPTHAAAAPPAAESQLQPWSARLDLARKRRARDCAYLADGALDSVWMFLSIVVVAGFSSLYLVARALALHGRLPAARAYAVLVAAVGSGVYVVLSSELSSVYSSFGRPVFAAAWIALTVVAAGAGFRIRRAAPRPALVEEGA